MMALVQATRIASQPTPAERVVLATATRLADVVAWRIQRRTRRRPHVLARAVAAREITLFATAARDEQRAQAHRLGLR